MRRTGAKEWEKRDERRGKGSGQDENGRTEKKLTPRFYQMDAPMRTCEKVCRSHSWQSPPATQYIQGSRPDTSVWTIGVSMVEIRGGPPLSHSMNLPLWTFLLFLPISSVSLYFPTVPPVSIPALLSFPNFFRGLLLSVNPATESESKLFPRIWKSADHITTFMRRLNLRNPPYW